MAGGDKIPKRLYKYRAFSNLTLDVLVADNLFFADPSTFNDPLDTRPSLETDLGAQDLERVFIKFVERRVTAEMAAAAKKIKYRGPKTVEHISRQARRRAEELIANIRYNATNPEYEVADPLQVLLGQYVEEELLRQYDKGIVSFAERTNCPLMWSHYGDQHKGVCIGYSVPDDAAENLYKVGYGGCRFVEASKVAAMLDGDDIARQTVDTAVLLRKAASWRYEREWRLIGQRGLQNSPLELEEVIFGIRCESAVKYAVVKALEDRRRPVRFYEMRELRGTFRLKKCALDTDELCAFFPRRFRSIYEAFETVSEVEA
ncbi:hypothetical protein V1279_000840 [Bradyrhizobium sp. AZCC 1610]|uniref:DUF2971 domain-containing protein n=1 Tax=Bradyrhizobium sp. AZCC 1610 TaxID=3117020 RepID=UPI002FEF2066